MKKTRLLLLLVLLMTAATGAWAQTWTNIVKNSDLEGTDRSCFYVQEKSRPGTFLARITDGIGVNGSRAIKVQTTGEESAGYETQFDIRLPYELPAGTQYRLSFDYKSDKAAVRVDYYDDATDYSFGFQVSNEPGQYVWWTLGGWPAPYFETTEDNVNKWQHYEAEYTVPGDCNGSQSGDGDWLLNFQTIYIQLAKNKVATEFIIDNIKVEIDATVLARLTESPSPNTFTQYPVEITSMAIMGDFLGQSEVNNWNPTNGWALTQDNSNPAIWKLTREFTAVARTYEYKIFANGNMDDFTLPVPADDKGQFVISEAGDYILTVTVDTEVGSASVRAAVPGTYTVKMKDGAVDAENWTITPTEATTTGVKEGTEVTLQYNGRLKVKGVKATAQQ